jgi:hypothetical protein
MVRPETRVGEFLPVSREATRMPSPTGPSPVCSIVMLSPEAVMPSIDGVFVRNHFPLEERVWHEVNVHCRLQRVTRSVVTHLLPFVPLLRSAANAI